MTKIYRIAKLELSILFYSPIAWLVLTIFTVQCGMVFFSLYQSIREALSMSTPINNLTATVFPGMNGLFSVVKDNLYLYIPLLTMGLMSRETSSGSIKLLLSSPVKLVEVILGKYLAMVTYGLFLTGILLLFVILGAVTIGHPDIWLMFSGLIGIFLLICTYAAIGLFMSSLTSYQVVAAISTLAVFAALKFVGSVGQDINVVRDLTFFLSISGRADDIISGLISTKDVLYFFLIVVLFLWLCLLKLRSGRSSRHWTKQFSDYAVLFAGILLLGYFSSRPAFTGYVDMTRTKAKTLTLESQQIAKGIDSTLTLTTYVNLLADNVYLGLPAARNYDLARFEHFQRFIPDLRFEYVYYYHHLEQEASVTGMTSGDPSELQGMSDKQKAGYISETMGIDLELFMLPNQIDRQINLRGENYNLVRTLDYRGRKSWLRFYNELDQFPSEREIATAIKQLLVPVRKTAFVEGHEERSIGKKGDRDYRLGMASKKSRKSLINQGFQPFSINLKNANIPDDLDLLVIADPGLPFAEDEMDKLRAYIAGGGNMLICLEPGRAWLMEMLLRPLGISIAQGRLVNDGKDDVPDLIYGRPKGSGGLVAMPSSAAVVVDEHSPFKVDTLLVSADSGWIRTGAAPVAGRELKFDAGSGDKMGSFPLMVSLHRMIGKKNQQVVVSGDADFMNNAELSHPRAANQDFVNTLFKSLGNDLFPLEVRRPVPPDDTLLISRKQIALLKLGFLGGIPGTLIILGAFVLIRRKRK